MKKVNVPLCLGIAYIACMVGMAIGDVGETPKGNEPFSPWLPVMVAAFMLVPFILGWLAANDSKGDNQ